MKHQFKSCLLGLITASTVATSTLNAHFAPPRPQVEVAFVLDTTGSMGGLIKGAKQKIWSIANEIASANDNPEVKFALIGYRDRGDQYITQRHDLTDDIDAIYDKLMQFQASGGGDGPESVNQALHESVTQLSWSSHPNTLRLIFLVGDAPPHMDYQNDVKYPDSCKLAVAKDIIINTIQCGKMGGTQKIWQEIANSSQGQYVAIQQSGGVHAISTPVDEQIAALNRQMADTVITYGDKRAQSLGKSKVANVVAAPAEAVADRFSYLESSSVDEAPVAISGNEDLVAQIAQNKIADTEIKNELLPDELKELSQAELNSHIATQSAKRKEIQVKLNSLLRERQEFINNEKKRLAAEGKDDGFDSQVNRLIREQAALKGISYQD